MKLDATQRLVEIGRCARALWTQRAEGSKAAEGKPMQWFLSTLGSILQTHHNQEQESCKLQCPKLVQQRTQVRSSKVSPKLSKLKTILPM